MCVYFKPTHKLYFPTHVIFDRFGVAKSFGASVCGSKNAISELSCSDTVVLLSTGLVDNSEKGSVPAYEKKHHNTKFSGRDIYEYDIVEEDPVKNRFVVRYHNGDFWLSGWNMEEKRFFDHSRLSSYVVDGTKKCFRLKVVGNSLIDKNLLR